MSAAWTLGGGKKGWDSRAIWSTGRPRCALFGALAGAASPGRSHLWVGAGEALPLTPRRRVARATRPARDCRARGLLGWVAAHLRRHRLSGDVASSKT